MHLHIHREEVQEGLESELATAHLPGDMQQLIRQAVANYLAEEETRP